MNRFLGKRLFYLLFFLIPHISNAQVTLNGSFEDLAHDETPKPWYWRKEAFYNIGIDNTIEHKGRRSLHIKSTPVCTDSSSHVIFQVVKLAAFKGFKDIDIHYKLKFNNNDSTSFIAFANLLSCPPEVMGQLRLNIDSIKWPGEV